MIKGTLPQNIFILKSGPKILVVLNNSLWKLAKLADFAAHMDGSNTDFAPHMEGSHAAFAPHIELRHSFRDQKIAQIAISAKNALV